MPRAARLLLPLALISVLAACNTDPFGVKPEVPGVEIPPKPAAEPDPTGESAEPA
jgi:hypothetical protein